MLCPQCGSEMPDNARFCTACGQDMTAAPAAGGPAPTDVPAPAPAVPAAPTAPMPQVAPPPAAVPPVAPPPGVAPPPTGFAPPPGVMPPSAPVPPPAKKKTGLIIAIVVIALLLLCCCGSGVGWYFYNRSKQYPAKKPAVTTEPKTKTDTEATDDSGEDDSAEIDAAAVVVEDYYAAIASADMDAIQACLASDVAAEVDSDWFEGWDPTTTFEFTRGILDGDEAIIYGRESVQAYGSGEDGGVKFTLVKEDGEWRIAAWAGADRAQIEGSDTTGSSSGVKKSLTEASARDLVTQLLEARQAGNANAIRQLTTDGFQTKYADIWLDGIPTQEYFTSFDITGVSISGGTATVTTSEEWNSGTETGTYEVISEGGALLVNDWDSQA